nr:PREDICTED: LOW QUALITY PROTEIN: A-agglutinin anchorage subunit-like [Linepithema humile]
MNHNQNVNVNILGLHKPYNKHPELTLSKEDSTPLSEYQSLEDIKEEQSTNCASNKKKNQRYTSSFVGNTTSNLSVDKEFDNVFGNNSKAKRTSSVHEGEDITLCWIETTTIKENKTVRPPNRLVIREYTISFENSATIPDRYLECKRLEGELSANDSNIGKTSLFEVIDEDTKISRVVNFTSISHVGDIVVWQHKRVKCGVGPVITKTIIEWNDGTKNPKKRVEIKVSPKLRSKLTATKTEEESCTERGEEVKDGSADNIVESCKNTEGSTHEVTATTDGISTKYEISTTEKVITESTSEEESEEEISSSTSFSEKAKSTTETSITTFEKLDCEENSSDPACIIQELTTPSSKELSTKLSITTEATAKSEAPSMSTKVPEVSTLIDNGKTTEKEPSSEDIQFMITEPFSSESVSETILTTEEIIPPTSTTELIESSETRASQPTDKITTSKDVETRITTSRSVTEESISEEVSSFVESTSEELGKTDYVTSSDETSSSEIGTEQGTTAVPSFIEFARGSEIPGEDLSKISESSTPIESTTATLEESSEIKKTMIEMKIIASSEVKSTTLSPTTSGEIDYSCENSEDCMYVSNSEGCESGNCSKTTIKSCESEVCSEEEITEDQSTFDTSIPPTITTKTQPSSAEPTEIETQYSSTTTISSREDEKITTIDNFFTTTTESRRSTITPRHKLTLKITILLQHVGENKEKRNLVEVEKQLSLDENPYHKHSDLIKRLKFLNNTVNIEAINTLLNCTSLGNLTKNASLISTTNNNLKNSESSNAGSEDSILVEQATSGQINDKYENSKYSEYYQEAVPQKRKRRSVKEVFDSKAGDLNRLEVVRQKFLDSDDSTGSKYQDDNLKKNVQSSTIKYTMRIPKKNISDEIKMEVARQTLPGIQEDVSRGLQHIVARLTRKNLINMASTDLLGVIADPKDDDSLEKKKSGYGRSRTLVERKN